MKKDEIDLLRELDPVAEAEKAGLGTGAALSIAMAKNRNLKAMLKGKDSYHGMTWEEFKTLMKDCVFSFKQVYSQKFKARLEKEAPDDEWGIWVSESKGIVIVAESYVSYFDEDKKKWHVSLNSGTAYFQYEMTHGNYHSTRAWENILAHSSGGCFVKDRPKDHLRDVKDSDVMIFDRSFDVREALIHMLLNLDFGPGKWVTPWLWNGSTHWKTGEKLNRFFWIWNHWETDDLPEDRFVDGRNAYEEKYKKKLDTLPEVVRKIIGF